eukprot:sb/3476254/
MIEETEPSTYQGVTVYKVQMRHGVFLNQLFKTNPTQPELAFYLIAKVWFTFFIFSQASQSEGWIWKFWPLIGSRGKNEKSLVKVRFKRLDLRFLEIGALHVVFAKRDPEFPGISGQVV